ncbi:hypothetical protein SISNIDRAFT_458744 [Sistotremastrum niveocremeum HHB9708]|uniref:DUF6533 domain-containing protein n=1 Tax=Sistotremastrum niveocremeum HHB9708 TaxID=1314777 RepID=A0A164QCA2_9AGAM|nr:hypothetical protein SISNIDRAFT_458744 [Sistotremastrum niveocremeum HHB9708]
MSWAFDAVERSLFEELESSFRNLTISRYMSAAGFVVLLWDTTLILPEEIRLVWCARNTLVKWIYLGNKYIVLVALTIVMNELSGIGGITFSTFCKGWAVVHICLSVLSIAVCNGLVLLRVCILWENRKFIFNALFTVLTCVTTVAFCLTIYALFKFLPGLAWSPVFNTCITSGDTQILAAAWGIPLIFDLSVFFMTCWNALDRPRRLDTPFTAQLSQDGLFYFLAICALRIFNVVIIWKAPISLIYCGAYFTWALDTTAMSRLLINLRRVEIRDHTMVSLSQGRMTPFGAPVSSKMRISKSSMEDSYELRSHTY